MNQIIISRPSYAVVDLKFAMAHDWRGFHVSEKLDGRWHEMAIGRSRIVGELMPDGRFFAFDIPIYNGRDIRQVAFAERLAMLQAFQLPRPQTPRPGESAGQFLGRILAAGGEGMVAARQDAPWGVDVIKVKRFETFDCRVVEKHPCRSSVRLELAGEDAGWCQARASYDRIHVGEIVEIIAFGRHRSGKLREARFVRKRPDKIQSIR